MSGDSIHRIRNLALVGAAGAGKTTLVEQLLLRMGAIATPGSIERGNTLCDTDPLEKEFGHSLQVTFCHAEHDGHIVNLLDTPGYPDFLGRSLSVLPAVETVVLVVSATGGVERITEQLYAATRERGLDCLVVVNQIDAANIDCREVLGQLRDRLGPQCLPINLPAEGGAKVRDCFFQPAEGASDFGDVLGAHEALIDQIVELDEALMQRYLEQDEELEATQLHEPFERALREGHVVPVCFASAATGAGLQELLQVLLKLAPDPTEANPPRVLKGEGKQAQPIGIGTDPGAHAIGHVFRVMIDPYAGRLALVRLHQGTLAVGQQLFAGDAHKPFRLAHLLKLQGRQHSEVQRAGPGDIVAISKVDELAYDTVVHDSHDEDNYHLAPIPLPAPLHGLALKPLRHGDEQKLSDALHRLTAEDPSLRVEHRVSLNETVLFGLGELHLRVALREMNEHGNLEVETHPPSVAYRETVTQSAEGHARHKKQTGGAGQFGEVFLRLAPLPRDSGFEFINEVVGGAIPYQFIPAVEKGVREVLQSGAIAGYSLQDLRVTVYDGKHHSVDSKEIAFIAAGRKAMLDAIDKSRPVVLEPIVRLQIDTSATRVGDINGELSARRGVITGTDSDNDGRVVIHGQVPIAELPNFQMSLKAITAGEGGLAVEVSHYDVVPSTIQQELESRYRRRKED